MSSAFDSSFRVGPSWKHGTLQHFFESFLSLERDPDALAYIENFLHLWGKEQQDSAVNSLHKKKMGKEMHINIEIGDYEVDLVILDLGSYVNILTKQTWKNIKRPTLGWSPVHI